MREGEREGCKITKHGIEINHTMEPERRAGYFSLTRTAIDSPVMADSFALHSFKAINAKFDERGAAFILYHFLLAHQQRNNRQGLARLR